MSAPSYPSLFPKPFADAGAKNVIPVGSASPAASLTDGFPPVTMLPLPSGGVPPTGEDFNGILNQATSHLTWLGAGGRYLWNSALSTAIGGYPKNAVLQGDDGISEWVSLADANTHNPNTPSNIGPYWAPYSGACATDGHYAIDSGAVNAIVVALKPPVTANVKGRQIVFQATVENTATCTIDVGAGVTTLTRNDGGALVAGDILAGSVYTAMFDAVSGYYYLTVPVASQYAPGVIPVLPTSTTIPFAGITLPAGFLWCDGSPVSRTTYAALFLAIGVTYGVGDNNSTFNVPDMRGRVPMGAGTGGGLTSRALAAIPGAETHQLTTAEMPAHTHPLTDSLWANGGIYFGSTGGSMAAHEATGSAGSDGAHANVQPSLVLNYIIKT